jgi:AcrR family transcriptional regulator
VTADKPTGPEEVSAALIEAAIALIVEEGLHVSVRTIADRASVNHGLIHTYFGSKDALLAAAADEINARASAEVDDLGFPPPDLAQQRGGQLAKALARIRLDGDSDLFSSHPVTEAWQSALHQSQPALSTVEVENMVAKATALALGWAIFADHLTDLFGLSPKRRDQLEAEVNDLVRELGGIPPEAPASKK